MVRPDPDRVTITKPLIPSVVELHARRRAKREADALEGEARALAGRKERETDEEGTANETA